MEPLFWETGPARSPQEVPLQASPKHWALYWFISECTREEEFLKMHSSDLPSLNSLFADGSMAWVSLEGFQDIVRALHCDMAATDGQLSLVLLLHNVRGITEESKKQSEKQTSIEVTLAVTTWWLVCKCSVHCLWPEIGTKFFFAFDLWYMQMWPRFQYQKNESLESESFPALPPQNLVYWTGTVHIEATLFL